MDGFAAAVLQLQDLILYHRSVACLVEDGPMESLYAYLADVFVQSGGQGDDELELVDSFEERRHGVIIQLL